jgi:hypothetical protein
MIELSSGTLLLWRSEDRNVPAKEPLTPNVKTISMWRIVMHRPKITLALMALSLPLTAQDPKQEQPTRKYDSAWALISAEHDKNKDGRVSAREYSRGKERFQRLDRDGDGSLTARDFVGNARGRNRGRVQRRREHLIRSRAPKVGAVAPGFTLKTIDGKKKERLASYKGKKSVALIFGSYT